MEPNTLTTDKQIQKFPSVFGMYSQSWKVLTIAFLTLLKLAVRPLVAVIPLFLVAVLQLVVQGNTVANLVSLVIGIVSMIWFIWLVIQIAPAMKYVELQAARGRQITTTEALENTKTMIWDFFIMSVLVGLIIIVGFVLLIVPGILMLKRYYLASYHLVDKKLSASEAISSAHESSKKYSGGHWALIGLEFVIMITQIVPLIGGIISFIMGVIYFMVPAIRYDQVTKAS